MNKHMTLRLDAVWQFVEIDEWQITAILKGVRQADHRQFIGHAKLKSKWEKKLVVAMYQTR